MPILRNILLLQNIANLLLIPHSLFPTPHEYQCSEQTQQPFRSTATNLDRCDSEYAGCIYGSTRYSNYQIFAKVTSFGRIHMPKPCT
jgi:hypothetical protein